LSQPAREAISDPTNQIFLSSVSTWEMAIKIGIGKLTLSIPLDQFVALQVSQYSFLPLFVTYEHAYRVQTLPQHHADPFDRLLMAQAVVENLVLLTCDGKIAPYGIPTLW
jgi:PIN domain nuclease of toxin-antitoxin system